MLAVFAAIMAANTLVADIFDAENRIDAANEPAALVAIRDAMLREPPLIASFDESRKFPFRKDAITLQGQSCFMPGRALLLSYTVPEQKRVLMDAGGLYEVSANGMLIRRPVPAQYENLFSLYNLNLAALGEDFGLYFESKCETWAIGIEKTDSQNRPGKAASVQTRTMTIVMEGSGSRLLAMHITRGASVRIDITMSETRPMNDEELSALNSIVEGKDEATQ
ncbi:MAG: hypothetical protein WC360_03315 [Opitutales bacterium]|jgi:hypothetical protein